MYQITKSNYLPTEEHYIYLLTLISHTGGGKIVWWVSNCILCRGNLLMLWRSWCYLLWVLVFAKDALLTYFFFLAKNAFISRIMYVLMLLSSTLKKELTFIWQFLFEFMDPFYILLNDLLNMWFKSERFSEKK